MTRLPAAPADRRSPAAAVRAEHGRPPSQEIPGCFFRSGKVTFRSLSGPTGTVAVMSDQRPYPQDPMPPVPNGPAGENQHDTVPVPTRHEGDPSGQSQPSQGTPGNSYPGPDYSEGGRPDAGQSSFGPSTPPSGASFPPPAWASAAPLPSQLLTAPAPAQDTRSLGHKTRTLIATALVCGLIGGGVGTGITLADRANSTTSGSASVSALPASAPVGSADVVSVAAKVLPSVVSIEASGSQESGTGSGIVLDSDGHILTNNHVVVPSLDGGTLQVTLNDGRSAKATIVGRDAVSDLAVIKVEGLNNLKPIQWANSAKLKVGQEVVAIGSPLGLSGTVTSGIVSALNRPVLTEIPQTEDPSQSQDPSQGQDPYGQNSPFGQPQQQEQQQSSQTTAVDAIQTDAAINPGNSGGALVDMAGRLVGINSSIATLGGSQSSQSGSIGLGFSIPANVASPIVDQLIKTGKATHAKLGASVADSTSPDGAKVSSVESNSAAAKAGLKAGDVVTAVDGRAIPDSDSLVAAVRSYRPGDKVTLTVQSGTKSDTFDVTLGSD
jgi:putative serine protease PepD